MVIKLWGSLLPQKVAQLQSLTAGEHGHQYAELVVGVGTVGLFHRGGAVHVVDDEVQNGLWVRGHNGAHLAQADGFQWLPSTTKDLTDKAEDTVQAGAHTEPHGGRQHDEDIADHQRFADLHGGVLGKDQRHDVGRRRWKHRYQTRWQRPVRAGTPRTPDPAMASPLRDTPEGYSHSQQDTKKESAKEE